MAAPLGNYHFLIWVKKQVSATPIKVHILINKSMGLNIIKDFFGKMFSLQYTEYSIAYIMLEKIKSYIKNLFDTFFIF